MPRKKKEERIPTDENILNKRLMEEIGLEPGQNRYLVDQDTGDTLRFGTKFLVPPGTEETKDTIEFKPVSNVKLMNHMFGYYAKKIEDEEETSGVHIFYPMPCPTDPTKGFIEMKGNDSNIIRSNNYMNDSLKYADVILQLNGEENVNLAEFDRPKTIKPKKSPTKK